MKGSILIELDMVFNHVSVSVKHLLESDVFYPTFTGFIFSPHLLSVGCDLQFMYIISCSVVFGLSVWT